MKKTESDWVAADLRPQRYLHKDPHDYVEWEVPDSNDWTLEALAWAFIVGFAVAIILLVSA